MKRVFVLASYGPSLVNFRGALIQELRNRGHAVDACAPDLLADTETRGWLEARGVTCHDAPFSRAGLNPLHDLKALLALTRVMRRVRPGLFIGYTIKPVIWGLLAARIARVPKRVALITGLGYAFASEATGKRALVQRLARLLYGLALRGAHMVFFQNPDDRSDFASLGLLPAGATVEVVNGSGVDLVAFAAPPASLGPTRFLMIARLLADKGVREYAAAAAELAPKYPGVEFHLVGGLDPNPNGIAREEVDDWVLAGHIIWAGALDDVRQSIADCHVFVLPSSYREGTPRTILEAMSMQRAIITTDTPGCRETVEPGVNGFLIPVRDVEALVEAMKRFLTDPALALKMGVESRRIAGEKYDVHKVNAAMIKTMDL